MASELCRKHIERAISYFRQALPRNIFLSVVAPLDVLASQ
jgi:hypothetical protein